jgi:hypothetical protein
LKSGFANTRQTKPIRIGSGNSTAAKARHYAGALAKSTISA